MARPNVFIKFKVDGKEIKNIDQMQKKIGEFTKRTSSDLFSLRNIIAGGAIAAGFKKMLDVGQSFENAEVGFATLLKSTEKAKETIQGISQDAQFTPFNFESLVAANRALVSAGEDADQSRKNVLALGNAIAASGGGSVELERMAVNLQQIKTLGKASALDIKQFGFAGINIYKVLAEGLGKTEEQVKGTEVSYEDLIKSLKKAQQEGGLYAGGLEKAMATTTGKISNFGDKITNKLNTMFVKAQPAINAFLDKMSAGLDAIDPILNNIDILFNALGSTLSILISLWDSGVLPSITAGYTAFKLWTIATKAHAAAIKVWNLLMAAGKGNILLMTKAIIAQNAAFLMSPIFWIVAGFVALIYVGYLLYKNWDTIKQAFSDFWDYLVSGVNAIKQKFWELWDSSETFRIAMYALGAIAAIALSPIIIAVGAIAGAIYGLYQAWQAVKGYLPSWLGGDKEPSAAPNVPNPNGSSATMQSANGGVIQSNTTTTNRSTLDVNFNNTPQGTSMRQQGSSPNITVNNGLGLSRP